MVKPFNVRVGGGGGGGAGNLHDRTPDCHPVAWT